MNDHTNFIPMVLLGLLIGTVFAIIILLIAIAYIDKKIDKKFEGDNPWKFKLQKPHTNLARGSFSWGGEYRAFKNFYDSMQRSRRCNFEVRYYYEAECNPENIRLILAFEKEYKITSPEEADFLVGKTIWSMIKKRAMDTAGPDFFKNNEIFGELAIQEEINPFDQLAPNLKISKSDPIAISYFIAKVV